MSLKKYFFVLSLVAMSGWGMSAAYAFGACKADVERLCPGTKPGDGKFKECLKQHENELSTECKSHREARKQHHQACKADKEKFCKDVKPGDGRVKQCLQTHVNELSAQCKAGWKQPS